MLLPLGNITLASADIWSKRSPFFLCGFLAIKVTPFECRAVGNADLQKDTMEVSHHLDTSVAHYFVFFLCIFLVSFLCMHIQLDMHSKRNGLYMHASSQLYFTILINCNRFYCLPSPLSYCLGMLVFNFVVVS